MEITDIAWLFTAVSMVGAIFNARASRIGFILWLFSNAFFLYLDYSRELYAQSALYVFFIATSVYGLWNSRDENN